VPRRVLIVDDEAPLRCSLREALRLASYDVAEALDGPGGIDQAGKLRPDVILLDVKMPGIDGYETCQRLKASEATCSIPVIFVTAATDIVVNKLAYAAGGSACVTKPFRLEALMGVIEATIASANASAKRAEAVPA
jgi:CheY-like chemotaxis protein